MAYSCISQVRIFNWLIRAFICSPRDDSICNQKKVNGASNDWIILRYGIAKDVEESVVTFSRYSTGIFLEGLRKIMKASVGTVGVLRGIRNGHLRHTNQRR